MTKKCQQFEAELKQEKKMQKAAQLKKHSEEVDKKIRESEDGIKKEEDLKGEVKKEDYGSSISKGNGSFTSNGNGNLKEESDSPPLKMCKTEAQEIGTS